MKIQQSTDSIAAYAMSRHARLVQSASCKLQEHGNIFALSAGEFRAVRDLVAAAEDRVLELLTFHPRARKRTLSLRYRGARYRINFSVPQGSHICLNGRAVCLTFLGALI